MLLFPASPEGILSPDKEQSSDIKPIGTTSTSRSCLLRKVVGSFRVLDVEDESLTIKVTLNAGHGMNYHSHEHRDEGLDRYLGHQPRNSGRQGAARQGRGYPDDESRLQDTILADTELKVIEGIGKAISVEDKRSIPCRRLDRPQISRYTKQVFAKHNDGVSTRNAPWVQRGRSPAVSRLQGLCAEVPS